MAPTTASLPDETPAAHPDTMIAPPPVRKLKAKTKFVVCSRFKTGPSDDLAVCADPSVAIEIARALAKPMIIGGRVMVQAEMTYKGNFRRKERHYFTIFHTASGDYTTPRESHYSLEEELRRLEIELQRKAWLTANSWAQKWGARVQDLFKDAAFLEAYKANAFEAAWARSLEITAEKEAR